jgi:hypothetical protein
MPTALAESAGTTAVLIAGELEPLTAGTARLGAGLCAGVRVADGAELAADAAAVLPKCGETNRVSEENRNTA